MTEAGPFKPEAPRSEDELEELLSRPSADDLLVADFAHLEEWLR